MHTASREVANLNEIKNTHTPVYGVKEFVCRSIFEPLSYSQFRREPLQEQGYSWPNSSLGYLYKNMIKENDLETFQPFHNTIQDI